METTHIILTLPSANTLFGWLVGYLCFGVMVALVASVVEVVADYGRTVTRGTALQSLAYVMVAWWFWPWALKDIRATLRGFNRPWWYYQ